MARNVNLRILASGALDLKDILEHDFSVAVREYAEGQGWKVHYTKQTGYAGADGRWRSMTPEGWPDLFMAREGEAISAELKREVGGKRGEPTVEQQAWLDLLATVPGITTYHWKPRDAAAIIERLR